jgi:hypothetical protein
MTSLPSTGEAFASTKETGSMDEPFDLPVLFKGEERLFPSQLQQLGYTHRILVNVNGTDVAFEPDEERNYRAIVDPEKTAGSIPTELLKAIAEAIENIVK